MEYYVNNSCYNEAFWNNPLPLNLITRITNGSQMGGLNPALQTHLSGIMHLPPFRHAFLQIAK